MSPKARPILMYGGLIGAVAISGAFAYGAVAGGGAGAVTSSRTVSAQRGTVSQVVSADGTLAPAADLNVDFATSGTVTEIDVKAGDVVTAGQVLARLDPTTARQNLDIANLSLSGAQAKLASALAGTTNGSGGGSSSGGSSAASSNVTQDTVDADQTAVDDAQKTAAINANGYQNAVDQAQGDLDAAQRQQAQDQQACAANASSPACGKAGADDDAVRKAQNNLQNARQAQTAGTQRDQQNIHTAQAKLASDQDALAAKEAAADTTTTTVAPTVDDSAVASARSSVLSAENQVAAAQKALDATTLTAPSNGTITTINVVVGDTVSGSGTTSSSSSSSGTGGSGGSGGTGGSNGSSSSSASSSTTKTFGTLLDTSGFAVTVNLPEADAPKVKAGQSSLVTVSALGTTALDGHVTTVAATGTTTSNVVTFKTVVTIDDPPAGLLTGMSASVSIAVQQKVDVVEVATAAITTQAGQSTVDKLVDGKPVRTTVTTGLQGDSTTEITSGLQPGDQVTIKTASVTTTNTGGTRTGTGGTLTGGTGGGGFGPGGGGGFGGGAQN